MERIKHLLLLLVFLLGVTSITQAQMRIPNKGSDLTFDDRIDLNLVPVKPFDALFTGCTDDSKVEIQVNIGGTTGSYRTNEESAALGLPNVSDQKYIGEAQLIPVCFRLFYVGNEENPDDVDILGLGVYDEGDSDTYLDNTNPDAMGVPLQDNTESGLSIATTMVVRPDIITTTGVGTYKIIMYYVDRPNDFTGEEKDLCGTSIDQILAEATIELTSVYGIELEMDPWQLYVGCVNPPSPFKFGEFTPFCYQDARLVIEYEYGENVLNEMEVIIPVTPGSNTTIDLPPVAETVGCGHYTAYIEILAPGSDPSDEEYIQASPKVPFKICADYPYVVTMPDEAWQIYKYEKELGCNYTIDPALWLYGPAKNREEGWTENGAVYFRFWSEQEGGSKIFNIDEYHQFPGHKYGNYGNNGKGKKIAFERKNFPDVIGVGCEEFVGHFVCLDGTVVSDMVTFTISVKYPVAAYIYDDEGERTDEIEFCMDPICPKPIELNFDVTNALCDKNGKTPVRFELVPKEGQEELLGNVTWVDSDPYNPGGPYLINTVGLNGGLTNIKLFVEPKAVGTSTYILNIYYGDTTDVIGTTIEDNEVECPVITEIQLTVNCCELGELKIENDIPTEMLICTNDTEQNPIVFENLKALYKYLNVSFPKYPNGDAPNPQGGGEAEFSEVDCDGYVKFGFEHDADNPATLLGADGFTIDFTNEGYTVSTYYVEFDAEAYGTGYFYLFPYIDNENSCDNGARGDSIKIKIDVRKPLTLDMLEHKDEVFYRANGSDPFGGPEMVLTNDELPIFDENNAANVVMDMWIWDPNDLVGYSPDHHAGYPYHYNPEKQGHFFQGIPITVVKDEETGEETHVIYMPQLYLQNGGLTQEPLVIKYGLRYEDDFVCCEETGNGADAPTFLGSSVCEWAEMFIVVKPADNAINQDLVAAPVSVDPICFSEGEDAVNEFKIELNAFYQEKLLFENGGQLPNGVEVRFRIDWVSGDEIIDLTEQPDGVITNSNKGPVEWTPEAAKAGKGVYMVTPYFNEIMTLTNGVAVIFTLEAHEGLSPEMVGMNGAELVFTHGDVVPAMDLDVTIPAGAKVTWKWDTEKEGNVEIGSALTGNTTIPTFTAVNKATTATDAVAYYMAIIEYPAKEGVVETCPADTARWTITVKPSINGSKLVADPVAVLPMCSDVESQEVEISATYEGLDISAGAALEYVVEFVSGQDIATFEVSAYGEVEEDEEVTIVPAKLTITPTRSGKGTYQLVPILLGVRGVPALFTVEVLEALNAADIVGLDGQTLIYKNGDPVESIYLDTQLPEGAVVSWSLIDVTSECNATSIGSTTKGNRYVPSFIAQNTCGKTVKARYGFEVKYKGASEESLLDCASDSGYFYVEVQPNIIEDLNLLANPVESQTICSADSLFALITFTAQRIGTEGDLTDVQFRVEFVSGNAIVDLPKGLVGKDGWKPKAIAAGTGVYRAVPIYNNAQGVPTTFTLTARKPLGGDLVGVGGATFHYQNGDHVPAISLDTNLPAGAIVTWTVTGDAAAMGLNSTAGNGVVPSFVATNTGLTDLTAEFTATISYVDYGATVCSETVKFKIIVSANTVEDLDLVMIPVPAIDQQRICNDRENGFNAIHFSSKRTDGAAFTEGKVKYVVEFVGGDYIIDLTTPKHEIEADANKVAEWTPEQVIDKLGNPVAGTGTYRVTPYWKNGKGVSTLFTLTVHPLLDNNQIDIQDAEGKPVIFEYFNGDVVPELNFAGTKIPAGVTIAWEQRKEKPYDVEIGSTANGIGRMPAFVAINKTNEEVTAKYIAWLKYEECSTKEDAVTFFIKVKPRVLTDNDLRITKIENRNQTICTGDKFKDIVLTVDHRFADITLPVTYEYVLTEGDDVLGSNGGVVELTADCNPYTWITSNVNTTVIGTGTYTVTPIMANYSGQPTTVTLTVLDKPQINEIPDVVLCNGEGLDIVFTSKHADTEFDWEVAAADKGKLTGLPAAGNGFINVAKLTHDKTTPVTVTISVTPRNPNKQFDCEGTPETFTVTVNPVPVAYTMSNYAYVHGTEVGEGKDHIISFSGVATSYKWTSSNPTIYEDLTNPTSGEVKANENGIAYMPYFKTANYTKDIVTSTITVTPVYGDCIGEPIQFHILVKSETAGIILPSVKVPEYCEGDMTEPVVFEGFPLETYYYITWTGGAAIGLADNNGTPRMNSIPSFEAKAGEATVYVTSHVRYNSVVFDATTTLEIKFKVYPKFDLEQLPYEVVSVNRVLSECNELLDPKEREDIVLDCGYANSAAYVYQWYKDGVKLVNANSATFTIKYNDLSVNDSGDYVCEVSSANTPCGGMVTSKTFRVKVVEISDNVLVEQLWEDVLQVNCIQSENGGFTFTSFEWFFFDNGNLTNISYDAGYSWIRINSADISKLIVVKAKDSTGTTHTSCPISLVSGLNKVSVYVAPSPVNRSSVANVTVTGIEKGTIQIVDGMGSVVSTIEMNSAVTPVSMPNTSGVYILRVIPANDGEIAKTTVIVK